VLSNAIYDRATNDGTVPKGPLNSFKVPSCDKVPPSATYVGVLSRSIVCQVAIYVSSQVCKNYCRTQVVNLIIDSWDIVILTGHTYHLKDPKIKTVITTY
jgi:hypothetical protein